MWPALVDELVGYLQGEKMPNEAVQWFKRVSTLFLSLGECAKADQPRSEMGRPQNLDYNTPGGKLNRGIATVDTVEIVKGSPLDDDEYKRAAILGWCIELVRPGQP